MTCSGNNDITPASKRIVPDVNLYHLAHRGSVILKKPLDYRERQIYQIPIAVYDGKHTVDSMITFTIMDVQNTPPQFMGSLTGIVNEDDPVGTKVLQVIIIAIPGLNRQTSTLIVILLSPLLQVRAKDGDSGNSRRIIYDLIENPNGYFVINSNTGEISVDRTLDRESLSASSGVLSLKVKASELVNGVPGMVNPIQLLLQDFFMQNFGTKASTKRFYNL